MELWLNSKISVFRFHGRLTMSYNIGRIELVKILPILSFMLILFSLYTVAQNQGVKGYEISLYNEYPTYFWYSIFLCIFICLINLILHIGSNSKSPISWRIAIIGMVMANSIVFLLPLIRRYALMGSGDPATHMGLIKNILHTGYIGANTYPMNHILVSITNLICSLDLNICMMLYPSIFYFLYVASSYLLLRTLLPDRTSVLVGIMLASVMFIGDAHFTPQAESNFLLPFIYYIYFLRYSKKNALNYSVLIIICSIAMTFYHPITILFLIFSFSVIELLFIIYKKINIELDPNIRTSSYIIMALTIIFFMWQSYTAIFLGPFKKVYEWLYVESTKLSTFEIYAEQIDRVKPDLIDIITSFMYVYGSSFILLLMGIISILVILHSSRNKGEKIDFYFLAFSIIFISCALLGYSSLFIPASIGFGRFQVYALFTAIFLFSFAFGYLLKEYKTYLKLLAIFSILLLVISYLSIFTLYLSPIVRSPGQHVTDSQLLGMNKFFETRNENFQLLQGGLSVSRMSDALFGTQITLKNIIYVTPKIPDHFGYTNSNHFGDNYGPYPMYLVMSTLFRITYQSLFPEFPEKWRFNQMDFLMLENDVTVSKEYSNGELDIYLLNPSLKEISINEERINN